MEADVRRATNTMADLHAARLPDAVEAVRTESAELRKEVQALRDELIDRMVAERQVLSDQVSSTIGAANDWFVRTRDQLFERLGTLQEVTESQARESEAPSLGPGPRPLIAGARQPGATDPQGPGISQIPGTGWPASEVSAQAMEWGPAAVEGDPRHPLEPPEARPRPGPRPGAERVRRDPELARQIITLRSQVSEIASGVSTIVEALLGIQEDLDRLGERRASMDEDQVLEVIDGVAAAVRDSFGGGATPTRGRRRPQR